MELRHLRYFVAVAEELSFTRAAARLHIGQPPLSQQIQALEAEVGAQLLERSKRWVRLTQAGALFLADARRILALSEQAVQTARRAQRGEAGELRIAYTYSTPFTPLFASVINRYRQRYPGVVLTLNEMATLRQVDAIAAREIDLGFVRPAEAIAPATVLLTGHALARQSSVAVSELKGLPFVMYPKDAGTGIYPQIFSLCRAAGFVPQVAMEVAEMSAILGLVAAGCGISVLPGSFNSLQMEGVVFRPLSDAAAHTPLLLAQREEAASPLVAAFVALVLEAAADGVNTAGAPANNSADGTAYDPAGDPADGPAGGRVSD